MKKSVWQEDEEYNFKPITAEIVEKAEEKLKVKLPESYISLLKEQDGGYINYDSYPTNYQTSWADDHIHIDYIRGIGGEESILESGYLIKEWGLPKKLVLISGDGHSWIAFDYRNTNKNPPIILIDHDGEEISELAPNFKTFLDGLTNWEESEVDGDEYNEVNLSNDEIKKVISEQVRNGRTNEQIMAEIDETITNGPAKKVEKKFEEMLGLDDAEIEKYIINKIKHHEDTKLRSSLGSYLLACAMGDNDVLDLEFVKTTLLDMQGEKNKFVRFYIMAGLENLGISEHDLKR